MQSCDLQTYDPGQAASVAAFPRLFRGKRQATEQSTPRALASGTQMFLLFSAGAALALGGLGLLMLF